MTTDASDLKDLCPRSSRSLRADEDKLEVETVSFNHGKFNVHIARLVDQHFFPMQF